MSKAKKATGIPSETWTTIGNKYTTSSSRHHVLTKKRIKVYEEKGSVDLGKPPRSRENETTQPTQGDTYGIPVDSKLAEHLVKNWLKRLKESGVILRDLINGDLSFDRLEKFTKEELQQSLDTLAQLLMRSLAITYDKNMLLKILSQPACEGIRFYVCFTPKEKAGTGKFEYVVSLLLVGVDEAGTDLHYDSTTMVAGNSIVPTPSLTAEYGHPPGSGNGLKGYPKYDLKKYVILKRALNEIEPLPKKAGKPSPKKTAKPTSSRSRKQ